MVLKEHKVFRVHLRVRVYRELLVYKVPPELAHKVLRALTEPREPKVYKAFRVFRDCKDVRVFRAWMVHLLDRVYKDPAEPRVSKVLLVFKAPAALVLKEQQAGREHKVLKAPRV